MARIFLDKKCQVGNCMNSDSRLMCSNRSKFRILNKMLEIALRSLNPPKASDWLKENMAKEFKSKNH